MSTFIISFGEDYHARTKRSHQFIESNDFSMTYAFLRAISSNIYFLRGYVELNNIKKEVLEELVKSNLQAFISQKTYLIK
jgi:hypothetical protein